MTEETGAQTPPPGIKIGRLVLSANLVGIALMVASTLFQTAMQASIRSVPGDIHPFMIVFFRNLFGLGLLMIWHARAMGHLVRTSHMRLHGLRGGLQIMAMLMFFTAVTITPLAKIAAISFTAPLFASLMAIPFLGEKARPRRVVAIALGLTGMLLILRPGVEVLALGPLLAVGASLFWGVTLIVIKVLSRTDSSTTITLYMGFFMTPIALVVALPVWQTPDMEQVLWLLLVGLLGTMSQVTLVGSFRLAEATAVLPFDFFKLIWGSVVGYLVFSELPDLWAWIGGTIIFGSTMFLAYKETR